jgi:hypothetical protein
LMTLMQETMDDKTMRAITAVSAKPNQLDPDSANSGVKISCMFFL